VCKGGKKRDRLGAAIRKGTGSNENEEGKKSQTGRR